MSFDERLHLRQFVPGAAQTDQAGSSFRDLVNGYQSLGVAKSFLLYHNVRHLLSYGIDDHANRPAAMAIGALNLSIHG
jgi:hypothetical protein